MKILKENAGPLINFEVLDFLRSRGAANDPTGFLAPVTPSEFKVFDYLTQTAAKTQTKESIVEFVSKCKLYKLTRSEIATIINITPCSAVELDPLVDDVESRIGEEGVEELVELIEQVFPLTKDENEPDDESNDQKENAK